MVRRELRRFIHRAGRWWTSPSASTRLLDGLLRRALDASDQPVGVIDARGHVLYANRARLDLLGWSIDEMNAAGGPLRSTMVVPEERNRFLAAMKAGRSWSGDITLQRKDGEHIRTRIRTTPVTDDDGRVLAWIAFFSDLTEEIQLQELAKERERELVEAKEAAERAARAKSQFLATMSHEIRTPMNGVIGMASLLSDTKLDPVQEDYVNVIRVSGESLLAIINDILDFSKLESNQVELECAPFRVDHCIEESIELLAPKAAERGLELAYTYDANVPLSVNGDATRLRQILVNLVGNGLKFTESGSVHVRVGRLEDERGIRLVFAVADTGIGIPADRMDRLFKVFSQVDSSTTRRYGGTGLGLAISKTLAERMGGSMWVESSEGWGSTFYFDLLVQAGPVPEASHRLNGKRILFGVESSVEGELLGRIADRYGMKWTWIHDRERIGYGYDLYLVEHEWASDLAQEDPRRVVTVCPPAQPTLGIISRPIRERFVIRALESAFGQLPEVRRRREPARGARRGGVLIVEDNRINQKVACSMLKNLGITADIASDGQEAVERVHAQPYQLVFMDMQMPVMDGLEATRRIRATLASDRQPVIVALTANALESDVLRCREAGMDGFLRKPIRSEDLAQALDRYLDGPPPGEVPPPSAPAPLA
jgi:PAS domain S-box-containing protein